MRALIKALCNSSGNSSGSDSCVTGVLIVSWVGVMVGSGVGTCLALAGHLGKFTFGTGIVTSGFLVRIINVVVAMYRGRADSINMPKTKPAKPYNCAWASLCHWAPLKILKLNMK